MSSAAQKRLRRSRPPGQQTLDLTLPPDLDPADPSWIEREQIEFAAMALTATTDTRADPWAGSRYECIKRLPPAGRSKVGALLVSRWLSRCGIVNHPPADRGYDLLVGRADTALRTQVRVSTLWADGEFIFQGLTPGPWDQVALLAIAPERAQLWFVPAARALAQVNNTGWVHVPAGGAAWLSEYGGTLSAAALTQAPPQTPAQGPTLPA